MACVLNGFRGEVTSPQALWVLAVVSGCSAVICALLLWSAKFRQIVVEGEPEFAKEKPRIGCALVTLILITLVAFYKVAA